MSDENQNDGPVAPADQVPSTEGSEGVHPYELHPDQPVFPAPVGVDKETLDEQGITGAYAGVAQVQEVQEGVFSNPDDAAAAADSGDGKPYPEGTLPDADGGDEAQQDAEVTPPASTQGQPLGGEPGSAPSL